LNYPSISVITVNYNNAVGLEATVNSVVRQDLPSLQYIVVDGGSSDLSTDVIERFRNNIDIIISEKDYGIYNAMNKGIRKATGEYILFLNSGDYFCDTNAIRLLISKYTFVEDIIYGDLCLFDGSNYKIKRYPSKPSLNFFIHGESLPHCAAFIRRDLFFRVGFYNEEFRIVSDWEFWIRSIFIHQCSIKKIPEVFSVFGLDGISSRAESRRLIILEKETVYRKYLAGIIEDYRDFELFRHRLNSNFFFKALRKLRLV